MAEGSFIIWMFSLIFSIHVSSTFNSMGVSLDGWFEGSELSWWEHGLISWQFSDETSLKLSQGWPELARSTSHISWYVRQGNYTWFGSLLLWAGLRRYCLYGWWVFCGLGSSLESKVCLVGKISFRAQLRAPINFRAKLDWNRKVKKVCLVTKVDACLTLQLSQREWVGSLCLWNYQIMPLGGIK